MDVSSNQYGVLLLNMGGPGSLEDVEEYIFNLLADPDMIKLPLSGLIQKPLARFIAKRRAPKVRKRYELIGGKSPIQEETAQQASLLHQQLGLPVSFAMRYTEPSVDEALAMLKHHKVSRLVVIPLYPQYSTVSTLSSIKDFKQNADGAVDYRIVERHYDDPAYVGAMQNVLGDVLKGTAQDLKTHLLFVAHSIPEAYIQQGDPYADEVERTVELICASVDHDLQHSLAYQSRVGPVKWRGPTLEEELEVLVAKGVEQLVVQPLSFVSENLETLFDLDIDFKGSCQQAGIKALHRVPTLGHAPQYIDTLAGIARRTIGSWERDDA
jgi:ferrochelatase